jgi:hypothetical protein
MRESNPVLHRQRVSQSLRGKYGVQARRWLGEKASYAAKHMWIIKHYGNANYCSINPQHRAKRFEWHNVSGKYKREKSDYIALCPSCHRFVDKGNYCKRGHQYTPENTYWTKNGWRVCRICQNGRHKKWKEP